MIFHSDNDNDSDSDSDDNANLKSRLIITWTININSFRHFSYYQLMN